ncbi:hypothetical protein HC341_17675 [Aquisalimonas sp. 2447]|uniref:hypothetical protein n=1 Tax=Aquisalimonas sp. 2447 TaxID=2740807 RepID=UPI0014327FE3|nr:hypothetical protein [Aquisalimonas sp. 2447]QIT56866.1 hypothetical protein HC341_17675 [Aquisalimonas sp. 2447]
MKRPDILTSRGRTLLRSRLSRVIARTVGRIADGEREAQWAREHTRMRDEVVAPASTEPQRARHKDLETHIDSLRPEFTGRSELALHHARLCVKARRGLDPVDTIDEFLHLWQAQSDHLVQALNSRWLLSAVDTFADYGTPQQRAIAGMLTAYFNALKMAETENATLHGIPGKDALANAPEPDPEDFWDGIEGFRFHNGDMLRNLIERMDRIARDDVALHAIFRTLVERAYEYNSPLGRMMRANRHFGDGPWPK